MKQILTITPYVIIIILLIYIGQCTNTGKPQIETKDSIVTVNTVDSIKVQGKTVYRPVPYEVIKNLVKYKNVDTAKIIENYLTENKYQFKISDSTGNIDVFLSVKYNQLENYSWKGYFKSYTKTIIDYKYKDTPKRNKLLAGLVLSGNADRFGAAPVIGIKTKKDNVFLVGYDVVNKEYKAGYVLGIGRR